MMAGLVGAGLLLALTAPAAEAQEGIRLAGFVQWIASTTMQVMTVSGISVTVDLTQADQSSYQALRNGQQVIVDGVVSTDRRRVVAHEIWRDERGPEVETP